ncbi:MAG: aminotransferase class IV [Planctomycetota bacterium]|nr:aminotransferase class IV [Planctomycetota bacterium]
MASVWLNGNFVEDSAAAVSLHDAGLLHAAGVFTTLRASGRKVFRIGDHLKRLRRSCEILFIPLQYKDEGLGEVVRELLAKNGLADARIRVTVTRGMVEQDPLHGQKLRPTVFVTATAVEGYPPDYYERGMTVVVLDEQKLNPYDVQAGHKTLNYFSRLNALREASARGAGEALWFNVHNYLESGSISNVFVVKNGVVTTPPTWVDLQEKAVAEACPYAKAAALPGITRGAVMELARKNSLELRVGAITINELLEADEVFLTNSVMGVMPVCRIERHGIAEDRPGEVTRRLAELLAEEMASDF